VFLIGGIIMSFFENIGKKMGEAAQAVSKKSSEIVEVTKLNSAINSEEDKIQKLFSQIGKTIYENYEQTGEAVDLAKASCEQIAAHKENIKSLREKIAEVKGIKTCISCGAEMDRAQLFCAKCGARNEVPQAAEAPQAAEQPAVPTCPSCNSEVAPGAAFCTNCGSKLQ
jgi:polyribonucleotide nucleotidyltransferase